MNEQVEFQHAIQLLEKGDTGQAEVHLQQVLARNPQHTGAMVGYIQCLEKQQRRTESLPLMATLHASHPENKTFTLAYVEALREAKRFEEAVFPLRSFLQRSKPDSHVVSALAETYFDLGDELHANAYIRWALDIDQKCHYSLEFMSQLLAKQADYAGAADCLLRALKQKPKDYRGRLKLGDLYEKNNQLEDALRQFIMVRNVQPENSDLWVLTGKVLTDMRHYAEAEKALKESIRLNPENAKGLYHYGNLKSELGQYAEASVLFQQSIEHDKNFPNAYYNLSLNLMSLGKFAQGFALYHWRWRVPRHENTFLQLPLDTWDYRFESTSHLLVWTEQGIGDGLFFGMALHVLTALIEQNNAHMRVTFACDPRLKGIFSRSFPSCSIVSYHEQRLLPLIKQPDGPKHQVAIGDLLSWTWIHFNLQDFPEARDRAQQKLLPLFEPYAAADTELIQNIQQRQIKGFEDLLHQKPQLRIGLSWHSIGHRFGDQRSLTLDAFLPMIKAVPHIQWVSLQYGDHQKDIQKFQKKIPPHCQFFVDPEIDAWNDMNSFMAQIASLDLVISIDNSTIHMAGVMGVPTWLLLGDVHNWRWPLEGSEPYWYQNMIIKRWKKNEVKQLGLELRQSFVEYVESTRSKS